MPAIRRNERTTQPMIQTTRIAFIGRKQGTDHRWAGQYLGEWTLERPRKDEEAGLAASGLQKTDDPTKAELVYVRINPERVNSRSLKRVRRAEARVPTGTPIINSTAYFERYADKAQCFTHWQKAGLNCPRFHIESPWVAQRHLVTTLLPLVQRYQGLYLRTSNEDSGKGIHYLPADSTHSDIKAAIRHLRWRSLTNKVSQSRLLAVEPINTKTESGLAHVYRAHVVGDAIIGGYALVGAGPVVHARDVCLPYWDAFVQQNATFQDIIQTPALREQIILACQVLGAQVGAVEFFHTQNGLCFLELNPMWGGHHKFGDEAFMEHLKNHNDHPELDYVRHWLDAKAYYKHLYQALTGLTQTQRCQQSA